MMPCNRLATCLANSFESRSSRCEAPLRESQFSSIMSQEPLDIGQLKSIWANTKFLAYPVITHTHYM